MNGRMIRELPPPTLGSNPSIVFWDARTNDGRTVPMGNYIVKIVGEGFEKTGSIVISR
jgi:flagellar hook assembly protein FlgD